MYKNYTAFKCEGCSITPLIDYVNNPIYQELATDEDYFKNF